MTSTSGAAESRPLMIRLRDAAQRWRLGRIMTVGLSAAAVAAGIVTYVVLTGNGGEAQPDPDMVRGLVVLDVILALLLATLVAWRVVQVWARRRSGVAGSRLHVKLVVLFSLVAVTPAIVVAVLSALLIEFGIEQLFNSRVNAAIQDSRAVANAYLDEHRQVIGGDAMAMANDLSREGLTLLSSPQLLERLVQTQTAIRALNEAAIFDSSGEVLSRAGLAYSLEASIPQIPNWAYERARNGEVAVITSPGDDRVRALVMLEPGIDKDIFLYVGRLVDPRVMAQVERTNREAEEYERQKQRRFSLEIRFTGIYAIIAAVLLLGAIWVGLSVSSQLASPIMGLIDAAERVRGGDLSARVAVREGTAGDEIDTLSRAFNRMTSQLATQRTELVEANRQLDERRRFSEAVLAGVTAGVIGLDRDGKVELPNRSAAELLQFDPKDMIGRQLAELVPEMATLFDSVRRRADLFVEDEIRVMRDGRARVLLVRIVGEPGDREAAGYVVTFDDVTDLLVAQRQAAWADVARRIAHEIKNPLTPIQLSAERLKRKYLGQITADKETFVSCTDTIIRQVSDIGRMVDEFSSFARMPAPVMRDEDLCDLARQAVFLGRNGYPGIVFETELPVEPVRLPCDARQVGQAVTNIIKNAVEAIEGREGGDLPPGRIVVSIGERDRRVILSVRDNGKGLPASERERLAEPYVTTRAKGTGLGLAIVKKIMEDHGGELVLSDGAGAGAVVSLVFHRGDVSAEPVPSMVGGDGA